MVNTNEPSLRSRIERIIQRIEDGSMGDAEIARLRVAIHHALARAFAHDDPDQSGSPEGQAMHRQSFSAPPSSIADVLIGEAAPPSEATPSTRNMVAGPEHLSITNGQVRERDAVLARVGHSPGACAAVQQAASDWLALRARGVHQRTTFRRAMELAVERWAQSEAS